MVTHESHTPEPQPDDDVDASFLMDFEDDADATPEAPVGRDAVDEAGVADAAGEDFMLGPVDAEPTPDTGADGTPADEAADEPAPTVVDSEVAQNADATSDIDDDFMMEAATEETSQAAEPSTKIFSDDGLLMDEGEPPPEKIAEADREQSADQSATNQDLSVVEYARFVKSLNVAALQIGMYPAEHPLVVELLDNAYEELHMLVKILGSLKIGCVEEELFVEDAVLASDRAVQKWVADFKRLAIFGLTFKKGVTRQELLYLLTVFGMSLEKIAEAGGVAALMNPEHLPHIAIEIARYERVRKGDVVVQVEEDERLTTLRGDERVVENDAQVTPGGDTSDDTKDSEATATEKLEEYLSGDREALPEDLDLKALVKEIKRHPKRMALIVIKVGHQIKNMESVVDRLGSLLAQQAEAEAGKSRTDFGKLLQELAKVVQQELLHTGSSEDLTEAVESLGAAVSRCTEAIKVRTIIARYGRAKRKTKKQLERCVSGVFDTEEEKEQLLTRVREHLKEQGASDKEIDKLLNVAKDVPSEESGQQVEVSSQELDELRRFQQVAQLEIERLRRVEEGVGEADAYLASLGREQGVEGTQAAGTTRGPAQDKGVAPVKTTDNEVVLSKKEFKRLQERDAQFEDLVKERVQGATTKLLSDNRKLNNELGEVNTLIRELSKGIIVVDADDRVVLLNRAAEDLLGVLRDDLIGRSLLDGVRDEHLVALARRRREGDEPGEIELSARDQTTRETLRSSSAVVETEDGRTVGMVYVLTDVSRQRELDHIKDEFLSRITDHLKKPLVTLTDSVSLVTAGTAGALTEEQARLLGQASERLGQMDKVVNQLVDASQLQAGELQLNRASTDLAELARHVLSGFERRAAEAQVELVCDLKQDPMPLHVDAQRIEQALVELVSNAVKFTPPQGQVRLVASCNEQRAEVRVEDSGEGIPEANLDSLTQAFTDVALGTRATKAGLGIGLSLARGLVELHGGELTISSQVGEGTTCVVTLPVVPPEDLVANPAN